MRDGWSVQNLAIDRQVLEPIYFLIRPVYLVWIPASVLRGGSVWDLTVDHSSMLHSFKINPMLGFSLLNEDVGVSFPAHYDVVSQVSFWFGDDFILRAHTLLHHHLSANDNTRLWTHHRAAVTVFDDWHLECVISEFTEAMKYFSIVYSSRKVAIKSIIWKWSTSVLLTILY